MQYIKFYFYINLLVQSVGAERICQASNLFVGYFSFHKISRI